MTDVSAGDGEGCCVALMSGCRFSSGVAAGTESGCSCEGIAAGDEEETDEDDQERVEDVVGEIHVLCIDADFVCLSTRGMKGSTRDGSVEECNLDSGAV